MVVAGSMSVTGAKVINLRPSTYWLNDNLRIEGEVVYKDMPDNYWGIGYSNGFEIPKSDSTTYFQRKWLLINGSSIYRIKNDFFAGMVFDVNYTKGYDESVGVAIEENYKYYNSQPLNTGVGPTLTYDSRDLPANAWKGFYVNAKALFYESALGGDNIYQVYCFDFRHYKSLGKKSGRVLALNVLSRVSFG